MSKNFNTKRGFTLVELIIVIAVIGVLAAILIPVFANVINKANAKSALSDARNTLSNYLVSATESATQLPGDGRVVIFVHKAGKYYVYGYNNGQITPADNNGDAGYNCTLAELTDPNGDYNMTQTQFEAGVQDQTDHPEHTFAESFTNGIFYLFPASEGIVRSIDPQFIDLSDFMDETTTSDDIEVVNGVLLIASATAAPVDVNNTQGTPTQAPAATQEPATQAPTQAPTQEPEPTPVEYTVTFTDGTSSQNKTYTHGTTITLADENPLTAPSGKEFDKFTVGGADATSLTVTANTTVTVVWKNAASGSSEMTLHLIYRDTDDTETKRTIDMPITCGIGETYEFNVTDLKTAGKYYVAEGKNPASVIQGTNLSGITGAVQSGAGTKYRFSYTRPDSRTEDDFKIFIVIVRASITDATLYNDPSIPNLSIIADNNTRSIPGVEDPIVINTVSDFMLIGSEIELMDYDYKLNIDIPLTANWTPFGYGLAQDGSDIPFTGTLDGNHKTISNLKIALGDAVVSDDTTTYYQNVGLFAMLGSDSIIQDLTIRTSEDGVEGGMVVGILAGQNAGTVNNVTITGPVNAEDATVTDSAYVGAYAQEYNSYVGSIAGFNEGTISNCTVTGAKVYGYVEVGGAVGENTGIITGTNITLDDLNAQATETTLQSMGMNYIGGFVGLNDSGYIYNCGVEFTNTGIVKGYYYVGGFVGENTQNNTNINVPVGNRAKIQNCTVTGSEVYGRRYVGGFCGYNESASSTDKAQIINCDITIFGINTMYYTDASLVNILADTGFVGGHTGCNNGIIDGSSAEYYYGEAAGFQRVGGFAGKNDTLGEITKSKAVMSYVVGYQFVGGFCGENFGTVSESFADIYGINMDFTNSDLTTTQPSFVGGLIGASRGTVSNCYAVAQNTVKGYNYVGGLMGANYNGGTAQYCFSHVQVLGATAAYSVAYVNSATMTGIFFVANQGTSTGATRVSYNAITASTFATTAANAGWSGNIWSYSDGNYPDLTNNPR